MKIFASDFTVPHSPVESKFPGGVADIISAVFKYAIPFAGILMLAMIIFGGYKLMLSQGNPDAVKEGKDKITMGIVGFLIVFLSWFIIRILEAVFGLNILG